MLRCPSCGFLWLREKILSDQHYDHLDIGVNDAKAVRRRRNVQDRLGTIGRHILLDSTCDIGTGDGAFLRVLADAGHQRCWGIEPSTQGAEYARSQGLDVTQGTIETFPELASRKRPAVITLFHVIEHLDDPKKDIQLLYDALPAGGHLVIETPNLGGYSPRTIGDAWELFYPEHLWYFDDRTLSALLAKAGFRIVAMGTRDFDMQGKSIGELLFRLGLRTPTKKKAAPRPSGAEAQRPLVPQQPSFFHSCIQVILRQFVAWTGRVDYVWVIAEKA